MSNATNASLQASSAEAAELAQAEVPALQAAPAPSVQPVGQEAPLSFFPWAWSRLKEEWARRDETANQIKWLYQDYLDSNLYQHMRFAWFVCLLYFEAFVWVTTALILLSKAGSSFWSAYVAASTFILNAVFSTFYVQVWLKDEIEDGYCTSYLLLWTYLYPIRLALRYVGRSCRRYARADEGTIRHIATIHGLQVVLQGSVLGLLAAYLLFVDGLHLDAKAYGLSDSDFTLVKVTFVISVLSVAYTFGAIECDAGVHGIAQLRLTSKVPAQAERNDDDDADMLDDDGDDVNADDNLFSMLGDIEAFNANRGLRVRFDLEPYDEAKELELQKRKRPPTPRPKPSEVPNDDDDDMRGSPSGGSRHQRSPSPPGHRETPPALVIDKSAPSWFQLSDSGAPRASVGTHSPTAAGAGRRNEIRDIEDAFGSSSTPSAMALRALGATAISSGQSVSPRLGSAFSAAVGGSATRLGRASIDAELGHGGPTAIAASFIESDTILEQDLDTEQPHDPKALTPDDDSSSSGSSTPPVKWEVNRYRRGTMHAMADAILERMEHLRKKTEKRQRSAAASAANTTDGGMTTRSVDADKDTLATDAHSHSEAEITGSQPAQFSDWTSLAFSHRQPAIPPFPHGFPGFTPAQVPHSDRSVDPYADVVPQVSVPPGMADSPPKLDASGKPVKYVTSEYFLPFQMDIGLVRQIQIHLMTFVEVVARVARWIIAWMAYGGVVFVLVALEIGIRYAIQVYFGSYQGYHDDGLDEMMMGAELRKAFAAQRKKEKAAEAKKEGLVLAKEFAKANKTGSGRRMSQAVIERRLSRASAMSGGSGTGRKSSVATKRKSVAGLPLALGSSARRQSNVSPSRRQSAVTPGSRRQSNATGRRKSVAAQQTGRRKSIANLPSGRRASSASGASGLTVLAGAGVPESKWQKAQKLTLANVFFPPVHGAVFKGGRWMATLVLCIHGAFAALIILTAILHQLDFTRFVKFLLMTDTSTRARGLCWSAKLAHENRTMFNAFVTHGYEHCAHDAAIPIPIVLTAAIMSGEEMKMLMFFRWKACLRRRAAVAAAYRRCCMRSAAAWRRSRLRAAQRAHDKRQRQLALEAQRMGERYGYDTRKFALRMHRPARIMHHDEGDELGVLGGEQNLSDLPVTVTFSVRVPRTKPPPPKPQVVSDSDSEDGLVTEFVADDLRSRHAARY